MSTEPTLGAFVADLRPEKYEKYAEVFENDKEIAFEKLKLVVNNLIEINEQRASLHKLLTEVFASRFAELASLIRDFELYARIAMIVSTKSELDDAFLNQNLTEKEKMTLELSLSQPLGQQILNPDFQAACDMQIRLSKLSKRFYDLAIAHIDKLAPNTCAFVGHQVTLDLIMATGGVSELAKTPACNIKYFANMPSKLGGNSSLDPRDRKGIVYRSSIFDELDTTLWEKAFKTICSKVCIAARVDCFNSCVDGTHGSRLKADLMAKMDKIENNRTPKVVRPLPIPMTERKSNRGGRQKRAKNKKYGQSQALVEKSIIAVGVEGQFDELGEKLGFSAAKDLVKHAPAQDKAYSEKIRKKFSMQ